MKYILNFSKFAEKNVNEMFDDENLKSKKEIDYISGNIDKKKLATPVEFYSNRLNKAILQHIPFFKKGNPEVNHDSIVYRFGDEKARFVILINGTLVNDKYHTNSFDVFFYIEKNNKCLNPNDSGNTLNLNDLLKYLEGAVPIIERDFNITPVYAELN